MEASLMVKKSRGNFVDLFWSVALRPVSMNQCLRFQSQISPTNLQTTAPLTVGLHFGSIRVLRKCMRTKRSRSRIWYEKFRAIQFVFPNQCWPVRGICNLSGIAQQLSETKMDISHYDLRGRKLFAVPIHRSRSLFHILSVFSPKGTCYWIKIVILWHFWCWLQNGCCMCAQFVDSISRSSCITHLR